MSAARAVAVSLAALFFIAPPASGSDSVITREASASSANDPDRYEERRWVMGTQLRIVAAPDNDGVRTAVGAAFAEAQRWDGLLSNYNPSSPLSRINERSGESVEIPRDVFRYLERARADGEKTHGAFDVTVGPLVHAYRDGPADSATLGEALQRVGIAGLETRSGDGRYFARLQRAGMALDPGGDGKGVAVDAMIAVLREAGVTSALVDFGGSTFYGLGAPPGQPGWPVEVRAIDGGPLGTVMLRDQALSLSASLRRDLGRDGKGEAALQGHIVDPRSGALIREARTAVVLSPSATEAEVLSTVFVVDGEAGFRFSGEFQSARSAIFRPGQPRLAHGDFDHHFTPAAARRP